MEKQVLINFLNQNFDASKIAKECNCSRNRIIYWLNKYNLKTSRQQSVTNNYTIKKCPKCNTLKNKAEFYLLKNNKLSPYCKSCKQSLYKTKRQKFKQEIVNLKGGKCYNCGYNNCLAALDLHHINSDEKETSFNKSGLVLNDKILKELDKCILLCANCHREVHNNYLKIEEILYKE